MDLMIDIETLGTSHDAVVCSIGWALFGEKRVIESGVMHLDWGEQLENGRVVDESTLKWWLLQSDNARASIANATCPWSLCAAEADLTALCERSDTVWCCGANFDLPILESLFEAAPLIGTPWAYKQTRDYLTLRHEAERLGFIPKSNTNAHNAEADARYQAGTLIAIRKSLKLEG